MQKNNFSSCIFGYSLIINEGMKIYICVLLSLVCFFSTLKAQSLKRLDSLQQVLRNYEKEDSTRVNILSEIAWSYRNFSADTTIIYAQKALDLAKKISFSGGIIKSYNYLGVAYRNKSNYSKAFEYYMQAYKEAERTKDDEQIGYSLINIANIYLYQSNFTQALKELEKALNIADKRGDKRMKGYCYLNMGRAYRGIKAYEKSLEAYLFTLEIRKELKDHQGLTTIYSDIGEVYRLQNNTDEALAYFFKSLDEAKLVKNKGAMVYAYNNIGQIYKDKKLYTQALEYAEKSLELAQEIDSKNDVRKAYLNISQIYAAQQLFEKAYQFHLLYSAVQDTIFNQENTKKINEIKEQYESEKRQAELALLKKDKELQAEQIKQQEILQSSLWMAIILITLTVVSLLAVAFIIWTNYQKTKEVNTVLQNQKFEIEHQKMKLEEINKVIERKNEDITASLNYAQRIQKAILPPNETFKQYLPNHFIFYQPRDIVSGDFYWLDASDPKPIYQTISVDGKEEKILLRLEAPKLVIAAVDCTGHGIPGAFMSMIGNDLLNQIVIDRDILEPDKILNEMHRGIKKALRQDETHNRDGMDMVVCCIDSENKILEFAGAMGSIIYMQNNEMFVIKGNKMPIGGERLLHERNYTKHTISIEQPTSLYLFSDGYQDQFGGEQGKKFMIHRFRDLLWQIHKKDISEQKQIVEQTFYNWKAHHEQMDDIMVIGIQL
ncbi:MAG: hypothetical protein EAZ55_05695 [Cytophagales bacterium]|nr:MAG: hypothetical protein EAZ55_05695 [Cytophagales bacterium]